MDSMYFIAGAIFLLTGLLGAAIYGLYSLAVAAMEGQTRGQRDQAVIVSELLAHRTLAETGNQVIAGQMLAHSNAHGMRTEMPQVWTPPAAEREELQAHESNTVQIGVDEDVTIPMPEEA